MASTLAPDIETEPDLLHGKIKILRDSLNSVLRGKSAVVENVLVCLLAQGHLLLEDEPGLGKTTLAKALANGLGERFSRVQCTPDLMPSDITGFNIFNQKSHEFEFREGPVFADVLLADEINRATPRTQSALLEAMAERQVTIDAERFALSDTFFVIATQNPIEQHGTYPLPEAQLDRFAMKLSIGYPDEADEVDLLGLAIRDVNASKSSAVTAAFSDGELQQIQTQVQSIGVVKTVREYLVTVASATRNHPRIPLGLSPRGLLTWQRCGQAVAFLQGRSFVTQDDLQEIARPVLSVRLSVDDSDPSRVIDELLEGIPVPTQRPEEDQ